MNPYLIRISSQKGGVGKTTIAVNLATSLRLFNYKVLLVDGDLSNPSIGFHLGLEQANIGYSDVLNEKSTLRNSIAVHNPSGLHVLPGTINTKSYMPTEKEMETFVDELLKSDYEFVVVDTSPGYIAEEPTSHYSEALLVSTPELSACTSSIRLAHMYDKDKLKHNLLVNRVKGKRYEITIDEIEEMYEDRVVGVIPEDEVVPISVSEHIPAFLLDPRSKFSRSIESTSRKYASKSGTSYTEKTIFSRFSIIGFLKRLLGLR